MDPCTCEHCLTNKILSKICKKCHEQKEIENFPIQSGYHSRSCRACIKPISKKACPTCGEPCDNRAKNCRKCANLLYVGPNHAAWKTGRHITNDGYVQLSGHKSHPNSNPSNGTILEHVLIVSMHLGRPLIKGENVHHRNGVRSDNRFCNLELWVTTQPSGQRTEDLIRYAKEILTRYPEEVYYVG